MIGYSLAKTAKLSKGFILQGIGRNGKSVVFRIIEALLKVERIEEIEGSNEQCSHEHLENLSGSKAGAKSTIKKLERLCSKYCRGSETSKLYQ